MGNVQSMRKINFEDMQTATKNPEVYLIINASIFDAPLFNIVATTVLPSDPYIFIVFV